MRTDGRRAYDGLQIAARLAAIAAVATLGAQTARAQASEDEEASGTYRFHIPAKSLAASVADLGAVTGWRIAYPFTLPPDARSNPISGTMSAQAALERMLDGSGVVYRLAGPRSIVLVDLRGRSASEAALRDAVALAPIEVAGSRGPVSYAGGQVATGSGLGLLGDRDVMDTPFSVTSYTAKTIADQQGRSVGDVVKNDPSVRTTWSDGSYSNQFFIRGFPVGNPDISISGLYGLAPYQMAGTAWVDRVEVLKGPSALLNGMAPGGSIGGAINLVPKRAGDDPLTRLTLGYASNAQFGSSVDLARRFGPDDAFGVRLNGSYRKGDTSVHGQSTELGEAALGLDYRGERLRLSADVIYQKNDSDNPVRPIYYRAGFQIPKAPKASADLGQDWYYTKGEDITGVVRAEYDVTENFTAYATFGAHRNTLTGLYNFEYIKNAAGDFDANNYYQPTYNRAWTGETGVKARLETGPVRHELTISATRLYSELGNRPQVISTYSSNIYDPGGVKKPDLSPWFSSTPKTSALTLSTVAVADSLYMLDDRLQLILGGRFQKVQQKAWNVTTRARTADYDEQAFTPAVGVVVKPWERVSLYVNYIEGLSQGPVAPAGSENFGAAFPPMKSKQYEAGVKIDFGRVAATMSLFQIEQPNGLLDAKTNRYGLDGETRNRGVELNVFGELAVGLRLLGGVAFMDGVQTKTANGANNGKRAIGIPKTQLNLGAEWDAPIVQGLTFTGRMIHTSKQFASADNSQSIPDWTRFDVGARYTFERADGKPVTLRATVENVFNKSYWAAASTNFGLARGAPRTVLLSSTFDF
ncbi:TonB-dependent receptor [Hansschlegelia sp.]|uniref:TonB-dependent receptor n=1 Tax=Hansschlegelia sp. TaxID=2041892 RepID=UPI002C59C2CF|nr:TonB-dependent receptor [Hansschlegelia sp.]HVI27876.1 TonB-dependent receptor [Hansschlegelia sp.]